MGYAVLFPGQGSQFVGMGADLFEARPDLLGDAADEVLGFSLREVCLQGPEERLTRTEHAQPALFALSYALWEELSAHVPPPVAAAGHSLGEYTALAAAGVFSYSDALAVVAERGRAMADASDANPSSMAAVIGADLEAVEAACSVRRSEGGSLWVANINAPGQVVVAGGVDDIEWLEEKASALGLRRVVGLAVAGAFHSPFMQSASDRLAASFEGVEISEGRFPVYSNVTAGPVTSEDLVPTLVDQVVSPVRFSETLEKMAASGIDTFVHVGPGDVTAGLARRTVRGSNVIAVSSLDDVGVATDALGSIS
jgi:[acyl-carrier-protein] S-malonyltransferase